MKRKISFQSVQIDEIVFHFDREKSQYSSREVNCPPKISYVTCAVLPCLMEENIANLVFSIYVTTFEYTLHIVMAIHFY